MSRRAAKLASLPCEMSTSCAGRCGRGRTLALGKSGLARKRVSCVSCICILVRSAGAPTPAAAAARVATAKPARAERWPCEQTMRSRR
eukprot:3502728-Prymnesium_polylepis.1